MSTSGSSLRRARLRDLNGHPPRQRSAAPTDRSTQRRRLTSGSPSEASEQSALGNIGARTCPSDGLPIPFGFVSSNRATRPDEDGRSHQGNPRYYPPSSEPTMTDTNNLHSNGLALPPAHDHPAMFSRELIEPLAATIRGRRRVLDPFAGTGRIHAIAEAAGVRRSTGIELEPEWANVDLFPGRRRRQIVGDSMQVLRRYKPGAFDAVLTSPAYGNRMADKHEAKDSCKQCDGSGVEGSAECRVCKGTGLSRRNTYRHRLGRPLSENNGGGLQWGSEYRDLHRAIWKASVRVLAPGGAFVANCSNHIRLGQVIDVCGWHTDVLVELGLDVVEVIEVETRRQRHGANAQLRVAGEQIIVCERPLATSRAISTRAMKGCE